MSDFSDIRTALARAAAVHVEVGENHIRLAVQSWITRNVETLNREQIDSLQAAVGIETKPGGL